MGRIERSSDGDKWGGGLFVIVTDVGTVGIVEGGICLLSGNKGKIKLTNGILWGII